MQAFQVFDSPSHDNPITTWLPEGATVSIERDVLGTPLSVTRSGAAAGSGPASVSRRYVYDGYRQLCKTIDPESGATVQTYDAAGNVMWRASGLALPSTTDCNTSSVPGN